MRKDGASCWKVLLPRRGSSCTSRTSRVLHFDFVVTTSTLDIDFRGGKWGKDLEKESSSCRGTRLDLGSDRTSGSHTYPDGTCREWNMKKPAVGKIKGHESTAGLGWSIDGTAALLSGPKGIISEEVLSWWSIKRAWLPFGISWCAHHACYQYSVIFFNLLS